MASSELSNPEEPGVPYSGGRGAGEGRGVSREMRRSSEAADRPHAGRNPQDTERNPAEPLGRAEYSSSIRDLGAPIPASNDSRHDINRDGAPDRPTDQTRDTGVARDAASSHPAGPGDITHYHGQFKGQDLDLYTDGVRWAPGDREDGVEIVGQKPDHSPGDISDLPPSGDKLLDTAGDDASRTDRFRSELYRHSDEAQEAIEKNANLVHDVFARPPASGHDLSVVNTPYVSQSQYQLDAGGLATAALALGMVLDRGVRRLAKYRADHAEGE